MAHEGKKVTTEEKNISMKREKTRQSVIIEKK